MKIVGQLRQHSTSSIRKRKSAPFSTSTLLNLKYTFHFYCYY